ncbi:MAG TPA: plastocyanin/azurin family copper-binding protein [Solirubrobacteraceae bacterium]|nr:plastocyanin/azurin family copper-binding protein [Solirubrobacteraceae bacterium]
MRQPTADQARPWRISIVPLLALVGIFALAGCGGSKSSSSTESTPAATTPPATTPATTESTAAPATGSSSLSLEANPEGQLKYNTTSLTAKAGAVSIAFTNSSPIGHNVTIESSSGSSVGATPTFSGGSKTLKVNLKPGTYKFYCSVPGHRMAGMEGTLTVK